MTVVQRKPSPPAAVAPAAPVGRASLRGHLLLWALISAAFTSMVIHYSLLFGKLAAHPFYDDLGYLISGLAMVRAFYEQGLAGLIEIVRNWPPHTVFSIFEAFAAYLVLGRHDWAPYAANGVIIFALAGFLSRMGRGLSLWHRLLLFLFVLTAPICAKAVYEFRPDIPSAMCAAMGATVLLAGPLVVSDPRRRLWGAGALFGLAMLIKTPTFPLTLAMLGTTLVATTLIDVTIVGQQWDARKLVWSWGQCVLAAFLVALPAYIWQLRDIIAYIIDPIFGKSKEIWRTPGNWVVQVRFYLDGDGERLMLGRHIFLLGTVLLAGLLVAIALRRRELLARTFGFLAVAFIAYIVPTLMPVKQEFFGTSFDWMLIFAAVYLLFRLCRQAPVLSVACVLPVLFLWGAYIARFVPPLYMPEAANLVNRQRAVDELFDAIERQNIVQGQHVYVTSTGYVNGDVFNYLRLQKGLRPLSFKELPYSDDLSEHAKLLKDADFVIASEQGNSEAFGGFVLSGNIQDQTLAMVRADPDFQQIASVKSANKKRYFFFKRDLFGGWDAISGLGEPEGPYPQWNLNQVQWGLGPRTLLKLKDESGGGYELILEGKAAAGGESMSILVDGKELGRHTFSDGRFERVDLPIDLPPGPHQLEFDYSTWDKTPDHPMAVLFKTLELSHRPAVPASSPAAPTRQFR